MKETRDSLKIVKIDLPKKDAGSVVEAAYLNGILEQVEKSINGLIDAQILFEGAASHRVQGLQIKPEGEEDSIYVTELDKDAFGVIDADTPSKYSISIKDIINKALWTNTDEHGNIQSLSKATEYAWTLCKQEIMDLWQNEELIENIKKEVLEKLLEDIQEQIRLVYRKKVESEEFDFELYVVPGEENEQRIKWTPRETEKLTPIQLLNKTAQKIQKLETYTKAQWAAEHAYLVQELGRIENYLLKVIEDNFGDYTQLPGSIIDTNAVAIINNIYAKLEE